MEKYIQGLVSVVMPTYKRSEKLYRAIESVLNQTYTNLELLLVNDNVPGDEFSTELAVRVKRFEADKRFHLIMQEKHINGAVARNVGIKQAKGEYIAFLDDDDWWKPQKIEKQVHKIEELSEEWGGVSCRIEQYDGNKILSKLPKFNNGNIYKDILMLRCDMATGTLLLRHKCLDKTKYFDETLLRHQDYQLLVDFTYQYKLYQLDELLHCCDISDTNNRPNGEKLIEHKRRFFKSIKPIMNTLTYRERKCIYCIHAFEVGYVFYMGKKYKDAMKYCLKVLKSPLATKIAINKISQKIISHAIGLRKV